MLLSPDSRSISAMSYCVAVGALIVAADSAMVRAAEDDPPAGRPWFVFCLSSLDQLQTSLDATLSAADRPELAEILDQRFNRFRELKGLDRTRTAGLVRFWPAAPGAQAEEVIFLPALERDEFLRTVTFDTVPFERKTADHYTIARPGSPYHVMFRNNIGWLGDRLATLQTCAGLEKEWTAELAKRHDCGVMWDLRQVPEAQRRLAAEAWRRQLEPLLQRRDGESADLFRLREAWSEPLIKAGALAIEQTRRVAVQLSFDARCSSAVVTVQLVAEPRSEWAAQLGRWRPARSPWLDLLEDKEARSGGIITGLPGVNFAEGTTAPTGNGQLAWQTFGDLLPLRTAVLAVSDGPVAEAPRDLANPRGADEAAFERVRVPDVPVWVRRWIGGNTEAWFVRDKSAVWLAFGPPELARQRLEAARRSKVETADRARPPVCLSARIPLRDCVVGFPWLDSIWAQEQLRDVEDRVEVGVSPISDGLQIRAVLPAGALRLIGGILADDLHQEAQFLFFAPGEPTDESSTVP